MEQRTIDQIRWDLAIPFSITDKQIESTESGSLLEARVNFKLAIRDLSDAIMDTWLMKRIASLLGGER